MCITKNEEHLRRLLKKVAPYRVFPLILHSTYSIITLRGIMSTKTFPNKRKGVTMAVKKKTTAKKAAVKKAPAKKKAARKPNAAFMKPMQPDEVLSKVVGSAPIPRTQIVKKLWAYIKKNGLQDKVNKRNINADEKLKPVFGGKKTVSMFEMTKLVSKHIG